MKLELMNLVAAAALAVGLVAAKAHAADKDIVETAVAAALVTACVARLSVTGLGGWRTSPRLTLAALASPYINAVLLLLGLVGSVQIYLQRYALLVKDNSATGVRTGPAYVDVIGAISNLNRIHVLAFAVGAAAGIPSIGLGNFTWDWVYADYPRVRLAPSLLPTIRGAYAKASMALRLPMSGGFESFSNVRDIPFVARHASRTVAALTTSISTVTVPDPRRSPHDARRVVAVPSYRAPVFLSTPARATPCASFQVTSQGPRWHFGLNLQPDWMSPGNEEKP